MNNRTHEAFTEIIRRVVIRAAEVLLTDVIEDIVDACHHLVVRNTQCEHRVQHGELRHNCFSEYMTDFLLCSVIRDDGTTVHLRTSPDHSQNASDRNDLAVRFLEADVVFLPWIIVTVHGYGDRLGVVAAGSAADRQQQIDVIVPGNLHALTEFVHGRVRHDASVLYDILAAGGKHLHDLIVDAILFDGTAAVDQLYVGPVFIEFPCQFLQSVLTKVEFRWITVSK